MVNQQRWIIKKVTIMEVQKVTNDNETALQIKKLETRDVVEIGKGSLINTSLINTRTILLLQMKQEYFYLAFPFQKR